ncbi:hypothetical protein [Planctomyces sp. SH-PL14]|uniref:hypothetical protein n=1 Tax=Planctomyces sp. SH-PL14 TaxID=1632864 RepID=UPI00078BCD61|nr:hypothetical protein [Planctomyces sp. SH-PL14]AMV16492.1 hypothetical protein VT03_01290 [Planctomyces sp. SH-PL14]
MPATLAFAPGQTTFEQAEHYLSEQGQKLLKREGNDKYSVWSTGFEPGKCLFGGASIQTLGLFFSESILAMVWATFPVEDVPALAHFFGKSFSVPKTVWREKGAQFCLETTPANPIAVLRIIHPERLKQCQEHRKAADQNGGAA